MKQSKRGNRVAARWAAGRQVLALGLSLLAALLGAALALGPLGPFGSQAMAQGTIIHVDVDALGDNNGTSWEHAFTDLQDALDAAVPSDEIWVAAGTYYPSVEHGGIGARYQSFQMLNGVGIYGGFDPSVGDVGWEDRDWVNNVTRLSGDIGVVGHPADNCYHVFYHPEGSDLDSSAILDGLTITAGKADGGGPHDIGAGMYNDVSSPALTNCTFERNSADDGGGMYNIESSPTLSNCTFGDNSALYGAGMYNDASSPNLTGCTFIGNSAYDGGGMYNFAYSSPRLTDCTFDGNSASYAGGGMHNSSSSPTVADCTFEGNSAYHGGGMANWGSSPALTTCTFEGNSAYTGGGVYNYESSNPTLTNCTFDGNSADRGGGMVNTGNYFGSNPTLANCIFGSNLATEVGGGMYNWISVPNLTNCTFSGNSAEWDGGGMYNESSSPALTNCILWGDAPDEISGDAPVVTYSDIEGGHAGDGNIDADPLFVDPVNGDYHLSAESPCIDAGTNDAPYLPEYDFEGDDRILDGDGDGEAIVDMGIDEVLPPTTMHVGDIAMKYRDQGGGQYDVLSRILVVDKADEPVDDARLKVAWKLPDGSAQPQKGATRPGGRAFFRLESTLAGKYRICVRAVQKDGYLYDPDQNVQTCETVEVP